MQYSGQNGAVRDVFTGGSVIAGTESVQRIADAVYIIEQLAQHAAPGVRARERVVEDQGQAPQVSLHVYRHAVVAGAIVAAKNGDSGDIGLLCRDGVRVE